MAIVGPIAPYSNLPIEPQFYMPSKFVITDITLGDPTIVTTEENHNYVIGQLVRLLIPSSFGTYQLNEQTAYVIAIPANDQVTLDISSVDMNSFVSSTATTKPQIVAVGDANSGAINSNGRTNNTTYILGSFINISP